jgi:leucyl aminopeptidase
MTSTPDIALTLSDVAPAAIDADLIAVPLFDQDDLADVPGLVAASGGVLQRLLESGGLDARDYRTYATGIADARWRALRILLVGAGPRAAFSTATARRVATAAGLWARANRASRLAFVPRTGRPDPDLVQAVAEGLVLAAFDGGSYKTERSGTALGPLQLIVDGPIDSRQREAADRGARLGRASNLARALANEPGNVLTPPVFADRAASLAAGAGLAVDILDERRIADLKMGLLMGVAQGSEHPPRVIVMRHEPPGVATGPILGLVGKGITFDSGGISIKPAEGMDRMKDDMTGGASVVAAMRAIAELGAPIRVIGVVPSAENMPSGRAIRPGDVLIGASGTSVEIINTDAEGRLILGDALWYARHLGATHLVDVATLTGACVVALGKITTGLFGTPPDWVEIVRQTGERAGDRCWPMPTDEEYREQLRSEIADLINSPGRPAGAVTAAMFLKAFVGDLPWAHLDIAGTAWTEDAKPFMPKGATGVAVRTLAELPFTAARWPASPAGGGASGR